MQQKKKAHPKEKTGLHPRNKHRKRYDFDLLVKTNPKLKPFIILNKFKDVSIDFFNTDAVNQLNTSILKHYYNIQYWEIPDKYLCPPIPGRADYIHHIADLLNSTLTKYQKKDEIKCLDIGIGANCIYPIIGCKEYNWSFIGSDIDSVAISSAINIIDNNPSLKDKIEIRHQENPTDIFRGIILRDELIDITICNPPFHVSKEEARKGSLRKTRNLKGKKVNAPILNFSGQSNELWCKGGEVRFINDMIYESRNFSNSVLWFTTLVSKETTLAKAIKVLEHVDADEYKIIDLNHGNKKSRILAWTFKSINGRMKWFERKSNN